MLDFKHPPIPLDHLTAFGGVKMFKWGANMPVVQTTGTVRVEKLRKGTKLFKLTWGTAQQYKGQITPWWSPVFPMKEDKEGALGRYEQAKLNGIDMSAMVRFMAAVCVDWNDLDNYVQVELTDDCMAFWGTFAPQKKFSKEPLGVVDKVRAKIKDSHVNRGAVLPPDLGVLEAWQLYIPNLKEADLIRSSVIPAHDMVALGMHFGFVV